MDLEQFDQKEAPGPYAALSPQELGFLIENLEEIGEWGEYSKAVQIAGHKSDAIACTWRLEKGPHSERANCAEVLLRERGDTIADMRFVVRHYKNHTSWELVHRLVSPSPQTRGKGIGTYALKSAEELVRNMESGAQHSARQFEISTTRPSLVSFARRNGYEYESQEQKEIIERYESELRAHGDDEEYTRFGRLPSFLIVKIELEDGSAQDEALADRGKLEEFMVVHSAPYKPDEPRVEPDIYSERLVFKGPVHSVGQMPFFIRTRLSKPLK